MDFNTALGIIRRDIEEARALLDQLSEIPGTHIAEVELARSRMRSASEMLILLPQMKEDKAEVKDKVKTEVKDKVKTEVKVEEKVEVLNEDKTIPQPQSETHKGQEAAKPILADRFSSTDRIGQMATSVKQDEVITSALLNRPISDIGAAIGINDRFYYIRELFSGDNRAYQDTIRRLNGAASLGEAMKILDESTVMGSDPAAQSAFVDVVRRKFNINV